MNDESINKEDRCQGIANMLVRAGLQVDMGPRPVQSPQRPQGNTEMFSLI